ncbi:MAG TPA: hypothetical protein VMI56_05385 [Reyranella sp.]|nr:hypothetical protein [Reyranella sp.]
MRPWTIAIVLMAMAPCASAQTGQKSSGADRTGLSTWAVDPRTGCKVFNLNPDPGDGVTWSGACQNGLAEGHGVAQWTLNGQPGDRYEGDYHVGKEHGYGVYEWKNGDRYVGNYLNNLKNGQGTYSWADGRYYVGLWKDGKAHGKGRAVFPNEVAEGNWVNGCLRENGHQVNVGTSRAECGFPP